MTHEYWCDILSTIEVKDNRKRAANQIKNIATFRAASHYDSDESVRFVRKNKASTGVQFKRQGEKMPKHHGTQFYCILFDKAGMYEKNYMLNSSEDCLASVPAKIPSRID